MLNSFRCKITVSKQLHVAGRGSLVSGKEGKKQKATLASWGDEVSGSDEKIAVTFGTLFLDDKCAEDPPCSCSQEEEEIAYDRELLFHDSSLAEGILSSFFLLLVRSHDHDLI